MSPPSPLPRRSLVSREQRRRRALLLTISALIVLALSPLLGPHVLAEAETLLAGRDHLGALCLIALHNLLAPVHGLFHLVLLGGLLYASWDRFRAWRTAREVLASLVSESPRIGDPFWVAARAAGAEPGLLRVADGLPTPAFTVGWWRPRVYVARSLADLLPPAELAAVIAHEAAHAARRDPLRLSVYRFLTCTLFWIPALRRLADDMVDEAEILADDVAAAGRPLALASAIVLLARWVESRQRARSLVAAVGFHRADLLERRVRRLLGEEAPPASRLTRRSLAGSVAALLLVVTSGAVVAHPLPEQWTAHPEHCDGHAGWAVSHLFCAFRSGGPMGVECPHL